MDRELRAWVRTLRPDPVVYWTDFLASAAIGWTALFVSVWAPVWPLALVAALALWRAAYFVHELAHRKEGELPGFELAWNLVVGIPLGLTSPMVDTHVHHHRATSYGTERDPEYERVATWSRWQHVASVFVSFVIPPLLVLRWAVLAPLSLVVPPLRKLVVGRASSLVTNVVFVRANADRRFIAYEVLAWAWWTAVLVGLFSGRVPWPWALAWWAASGSGLALNQLRTNVSHFYENDGSRMSFDEQVADSVTLEGGLVTWLMTPVGTAHHALHHLFPSLAYHHLPRVHARLVKELPADAPYRATIRSGIASALREAWRRRRASESRPERQYTAM